MRQGKPKHATAYTSRLQKGGALLEEMRTLVRAWGDGDEAAQRLEAVRENVLHRATRARAKDVVDRAFIPRFVHGAVPGAWGLARALEDAGAPVSIVRPFYYWVTARAEPLLADFVRDRLASGNHPDEVIGAGGVVRWMRGKGVAWSEVVVIKTARAMLAGLRDFGILQGAAHKRLSSTRISGPAFAYIAFCLIITGAVSREIVGHPDWQLFLLTPSEVEQYLFRAHQEHLLEYHAAGSVVVLSFPATSPEEYARVIAAAAR